MDLEFHYYINYLIALEAKFTPDQSYKIAYSAQFVDDNSHEYYLCNNDHKNVFINDISQTYNIFYDDLELLKCYACHHFLPGDKKNLDKKLRYLKIAPLLTTPNSSVAKIILRKALLENDPFLIGIASHAFCDTWAHQNFTALNHSVNSQDGILHNLIPNYGHADFFSMPDTIGLIWHDSRLTNTVINNNERFLDAARYLYREYARFNDVLNVDFQSTLLYKNIKKIISCNDDNKLIYDKSYRIVSYQNLCKQLYNARLSLYKSNIWEKCAFYYNDNERKHFICYNFENSNWLNFQLAIQKYKFETWEMIKNLYA